LISLEARQAVNEVVDRLPFFAPPDFFCAEVMTSRAIRLRGHAGENLETAQEK
jgi:hypothetical protein